MSKGYANWGFIKGLSPQPVNSKETNAALEHPALDVENIANKKDAYLRHSRMRRILTDALADLNKQSTSGSWHTVKGPKAVDFKPDIDAVTVSVEQVKTNVTDMMEKLKESYGYDGEAGKEDTDMKPDVVWTNTLDTAHRRAENMESKIQALSDALVGLRTWRMNAQFGCEKKKCDNKCTTAILRRVMAASSLQRPSGRVRDSSGRIVKLRQMNRSVMHTFRFAHQEQKLDGTYAAKIHWLRM